MSSNSENEIDHNTSRKSENPLSDPIITDENTYDFLGIKDLRNQNPFRVIIGYINISSIRNKFEPLVSFINNNLNILTISETKFDDTFPNSQFFIEGFLVPYRLDRTAKGGEILLYIREDIPSKRIKKVTFDELFEGFFIEINLRSKKWLLGCSYNRHRDKITPHLRNISTALNKLFTDYENVILLGDLNVEVKEKNLSNFMSVPNLKTLIKQKTCFKNPENPACIDLILTNSPQSFQNSSVFETGLFDCHKLIITVLKQYFPKFKQKVVNYRDYRNFRNNEYRAELEHKYRAKYLELNVLVGFVKHMLENIGFIWVF